MTDTIDTKDKSAEAAAQPAVKAASRPALTWISVVLTLAAWALLMWANGYVALAAGIAAMVTGFIGHARGAGGIRRIAVVSIIASTVLVVVVAAFAIVIKIGLG